MYSARISPWFTRVRRDERGAAVVEFALVVPLLLILLCAMIDFGLAMFTLNNINAAVREGGRVAAVRSTLVANDPLVQQRVVDYVRDVTGRTIALNTVTVQSVAAAPYMNVRVTLTGFTYTPVTPLAPLFGLGTITYPPRVATFRWERS